MVGDSRDTSAEGDTGITSTSEHAEDPADHMTVRETTDTNATLVGVGEYTDETEAHIKTAIEKTEADTVAVQIDEVRRSQLQETDGEDIAPSDVMSGKTGYQFLGYWLTSKLRDTATDAQHTDPGGELQDLASSVDDQTAVTPVDRDIGETGQRLWATMGLGTKTGIVGTLTARLGGGPLKAATGIGMFWGLLFGAIIGLFLGPVILSADGPAAVDIPVFGGAMFRTLDTVLLILAFGVVFTVPLYGVLQYATTRFDRQLPSTIGGVDAIDPVVNAFAGSQAATEQLLDGRDAYIAHRIEDLQSTDNHVLAVLDHRSVDPVKQYVNNPEMRPPLETITGPVETSRLKTGLYKAIGYGFTVVFLALIGLLALGSVQNTVLFALFAAWFAVNFVAAAGVAYGLGAHWKSATAGGAVAWFTSVNPMITPGLFIGYVELRYRTVRLSDLSQMKSMITNSEYSLLTRINRMRSEIGLFHILFVMTFANLISFFAGVLFVAALLPYFGADIGSFDELGQALAENIGDGIEVVQELLPMIVMIC